MTANTAGVMLERRHDVGDLVHSFGGVADESVRSQSVVRVTSPEDAQTPEDLVLIVSPRYVAAGRRAPGVLLCDATLRDSLPEGRRWAHDFPWWVFSELVGHAARSQHRAGVATVHPGARVHETARLATGAVIHDDVEIGEGAVVGEYAVVYGGAVLGRRVIVGPHSVIGRAGFGFARGPSGPIRIAHAGGVVIEDDVEIGAHCTVDAGTVSPTRIGAGAKLDAHVHVAHNVHIGPSCFVAAQVGFAGSSAIGAGVLVGGQAGFADHVRVGAGSRVAAKSGVIGDIPDAAVVAGFPAVSRVRWLRAMARLLRGR